MKTIIKIRQPIPLKLFLVIECVHFSFLLYYSILFDSQPQSALDKVYPMKTRILILRKFPSSNDCVNGSIPVPSTISSLATRWILIWSSWRSLTIISRAITTGGRSSSFSLLTTISTRPMAYHTSKTFILMHHFSKFWSPPLSVLFFCLCEKVYHKQEVRFLLYLLGQIVTWQS